jgi:hypothetical protein
MARTTSEKLTAAAQDHAEQAACLRLAVQRIDAGDVAAAREIIVELAVTQAAATQVAGMRARMAAAGER